MALLRRVPEPTFLASSRTSSFRAVVAWCRRGRRVRAAGARAPARRADHAAVHARREPVAGARRRRLVSSQGILHAPAAAAALHGGSARLRRFCVSHARRPGSGPSPRFARARRAPADRTGESLAYHGERNHFSNWFKARTEFALADRVASAKVSDFATVEDLRAGTPARRSRRTAATRTAARSSNSTAPAFDRDTAFSRIGGGSLGGKARGLAFVDTLLLQSGVGHRFPAIDIHGAAG